MEPANHRPLAWSSVGAWPTLPGRLRYSLRGARRVTMDEQPGATFGDLLRRNRPAAGVTREELVGRAPVSPRPISYRHRGGRNPPLRHSIQLLATAPPPGGTRPALA